MDEESERDEQRLFTQHLAQAADSQIQQQIKYPQVSQDRAPRYQLTSAGKDQTSYFGRQSGQNRIRKSSLQLQDDEYRSRQKLKANEIFQKAREQYRKLQQAQNKQKTRVREAAFKNWQFQRYENDNVAAIEQQRKKFLAIQKDYQKNFQLIRQEKLNLQKKLQRYQRYADTGRVGRAGGGGGRAGGAGGGGDDPNDGPAGKLTFKYIPGSFSRFAVGQQNKLNDSQFLIKDIVTQATYSHLKKMEADLSQFNQIQKQSANLESRLKLYYSGNIFQCLRNPKQSFMKQYPKKITSLEDLFQKFFHFMEIAKKLAVVDGSILQKQNLQINHSFKLQQSMLIPTTYSDKLFLKIGAGKVPIPVVYRDGQFLNYQQLSIFSKKTKQSIIEMVLLYLQQKGVVSSKLRIQAQISKHLDQNGVKLQE